MASKASAYLAELYRAWGRQEHEEAPMTFADVRAMMESWHLATLEAAGVSYEDGELDGVPVKWALPPDPGADRAVLYLHGGAFMFGSTHTHRKLAGHLAKALRQRVAVVDYRLAPERPYPAGLDDCVTAFNGLLRGTGVGAEGVTIMGDSAGGNLTVATTLRMRDAGLPVPGCLVLLSPWIDMEHSGASIQTNAATDALFPGKEAAMQGSAAYVGGADRTDPYLNALYADLTGLPPIYVNAGGDECLVDDARRVAQRASEAGVDVTLTVAEGMQHVYPLLAGRAPEADAEIRAIAEWVESRQHVPGTRA